MNKQMISIVEPAHTDIIYTFSDETYITPETAFKSKDLDNLSPYQIFTGIGVAITFELARLVRKQRFYRDVKAVKRLRKRHPEIEILSVQECFYVYAVKQNISDPFDCIKGKMI